VEADGAFDYFELADEVLVSDLVRVHRGEPAGDSELAVINQLGDDGLQVPVALYNAEANQDCTIPDEAGVLTVECKPEPTVESKLYYVDLTCSDHPVVAVPGSGKPQLVAVHDEQTGCASYYRLGRGLSLPPFQLLFERVGDMCISTTRPDGQFFETAERTHVPMLGRLRDSGSERIREITRVADGLILRDPFLYDIELDIECRHNDNLLCTPPAVGIVAASSSPRFYIDQNCQLPIGLAIVPRGVCDPSQRFTSDGASYYELLEPYPSPIYSMSTDSQCISYALPAQHVAYKIGNPVDETIFAQATRVIDP
jgi:hypothetical protein